MDRLALIGVSHRRGGAEALEAWHARFADPAAVHALGLERAVVLATCNRWELVAHLPEGIPLDEVRRRFVPHGQQRRPYAYLGDGALEQLARVAAGLDSLNPGEDQIMKQVREAYLRARDAGHTDKLLSYAFERALRIAKRVRREVALAPLHTSLFSLARPELEAALRRDEPVAVLGAGEIGALAARGLRDLGARVTIVNRDARRGERLAAELGAEAAPLDGFLARPPRLAALVCATPVRHLVGAALLRRAAPRLTIDLGVPRNVDPEAAREVGARVLDVDGLQAAGRARRAELADKLAEAEGLVLEEIDAAVDEWAERQLGPSIGRLRELYRASIDGDLPDAQAESLAHRFAHVPMKGLRALARAHGLDAARTFLREAGLDDHDVGAEPDPGAPLEALAPAEGRGGRPWGDPGRGE